MQRRNHSPHLVVLILLHAFVWVSCEDTIDLKDQDLLQIEYQPEYYIPTVPESFPQLEQPADNPMTKEGIALGRKLFFDPILSLDSTISCSSCHQPSKGFTDGLARSEGVNGTTPRGSMSLLNVGFHYHGFFWDGRSKTLEEQALLPVEDPIEMAETWPNVERKLKEHPTYPGEFRKAFGISRRVEIDRFLVAKALAQFERSLISGGNSKFDRSERFEIFLEESEYNGYLMFFDLDDSWPDAECGHCHNVSLFATSDYFNNGLQYAQDTALLSDKGLGLITGKMVDMGKFKAPTLRNLIYSAPYMHDGRFATLDEVIDHYNSGGHYSPTKDPLIYPLKLSESQKSDLKSFLLTLTDSTFLANPDFQNPF